MAVAVLVVGVVSVACGHAYEAREAADGGSASDAAADGQLDASAQADASAEAGSLDAAGPDGAPDPLPGVSRIFVTSATYNGFIGGLAAADARCAAAAAGQGFPGIYKAWLSSLTEGAYSRIKGDGPWYRADGLLVVFVARVALQSGMGPQFPVLASEKGFPVQGEPVWTGTHPDGTATSATCSDWSATFGMGTVGGSDQIGSAWTEAASLTAPCSSQAHLICLRAD
jgi:hypothetical protein